MKRLFWIVMSLALVFGLAAVFVSNAVLTPNTAVVVEEPAEVAEPATQGQRAEPDRPFTFADIAQTGRPQFLNGYATWCPYCQQNDPIIFALQRQYKDQIDFIHLNVDSPGVLDAAAPYTITGVTQYALLDAEGNVVYKWFSYLDQKDVSAIFDEYLAARV